MQYYDQPITDSTNWNGDASTGGLHVRGNRVQEWIKNKFTSVSSAITTVEQQLSQSQSAPSTDTTDYPSFG